MYIDIKDLLAGIYEMLCSPCLANQLTIMTVSVCNIAETVMNIRSTFAKCVCILFLNCVGPWGEREVVKIIVLLQTVARCL